MPELPEVETVAVSLRPYLVGKTITQVTVLKPKSCPQAELLTYVIGQTIASVQRQAKMVDLSLTNDYHLLVHLKMTGQLLYRQQNQLAGGGHPTTDFLSQLPGKHTRVIFDLSDDSQLFFNDQRIFGWIKILTTDQLTQELNNYGPDASSQIDQDYFCHQLARRRQTIKQVLMDNRVVTGIGNIYAAEILFASRIDPRRPANSLTNKEIKLLLTHTNQILRQAIAERGTTFDGRYVDADGQGGNYEAKLQVYGRTGQPCSHCGEQLHQIKIGGRSTVFCPECQR